MKELLCILKKWDFRTLIVTETTNPLIQFIRYIFVGGTAFLADAFILYVLHFLGMFYLLAAAIAFIVGLVVNFLLAKYFVFVQNSKYTSRFGEFLVCGIIGLVGLALTEFFMFVFTGLLGKHFMIAKIIAAAIVLAWNFAARKFILYR